MDSIIVFDSSNYPVLTRFGPTFLDCIAHVAAKHGLVRSQTKLGARQELDTDEETLKNVLVMLFAPMAASIRILRTKAPTGCSLLNDIYKSARTAHVQHMDQLFLYIYDSSNPTINVQRIERRLEMFKQLSAFLFGANIRSAKLDLRQASLLTIMFDHWLKNEDKPDYLVEAVEHLIISGQLQATFRRLLQCVLGKLREQLWAFDEQPCHSLAFVDDKLFSSLTARGARPLTKRNVLLLSTLVQAQRSQWQHEDEPSRRVFDADPSIRLEPLSESDEERITRDYFGDGEDTENSSDDDHVEDASAALNRSFSHPINSRRRLSNQSKSSKSSKQSSRKSSRTELDSNSNQPQLFSSQIVFMNGSECTNILLPFCVRLINLSDDLTLLIVAETRTMDLTAALHVLLEMLLTIQYNRHDLNGFISLNKFERAVTKLKRNLKHTNSKKLIKPLEQLSSGEFRKWLLSFDSSELPSSIDALCASICASLRDFYYSCVYAHEAHRLDQLDANKDVLSQLDWTRLYCEQRLADYGPFLRVKSTRNLTLDPFLTDCPNLVTILYIDRVRNEFVYSISDDVLNLTSSNLYNCVLPEALRIAYEKLSTGCLRSKWNFDDRDLSVTYVMWFEDLSGQRLSPKVIPQFKLSQCPKMISTNFIQEIIGKVFADLDEDEIDQHGPIACYELMYIQRNVSPSEQICDADQARRLATRLWDITAARTFIND